MTEVVVTADHEPEPRGRIALLLGGARTRILAAFVILLAFSTLLSVLAIRQLLLVRTADRVDASLTQEVDEFRTLVQGNNPADGTPIRGRLRLIFDTFFDRNVPGAGETLVAYVEGRQHAVESGGSGGAIPEGAHPARWATLKRPERGNIETPVGTVRYLAVPVGGSNVSGVFVVAASLSTERREVEEAVRLAALVLVSVLLIASVLAWVVAGRVLAPLRLLAETARSIGESDLTRRIPVTGRDEIADLSRTFNDMLDRLEAAFAAQRQFVSDASHELRTPITIVRGQLEVLGDDPDERRETIALVTDELDRMSRFVDDLLLLAKAERDDFLRVSELEHRRLRPGARGRRRAARRPHAARRGGGRRRRADREGVHAAGDVPTPSRAGPQPRAAALARLGLRLRPGLERRRRLCRLPAPQARRRAVRDRARHGLQAPRLVPVEAKEAERLGLELDLVSAVALLDDDLPLAVVAVAGHLDDAAGDDGQRLGDGAPRPRRVAVDRDVVVAAPGQEGGGDEHHGGEPHVASGPRRANRSSSVGRAPGSGSRQASMIAASASDVRSRADAGRPSTSSPVAAS
jgi:HAMP domain-containing protein